MKYLNIETNTIYNENNLDTMSRMPDNFIDLTVTSPPYDNLRDYKGYSFDFENVAKELFRVTKQGGVVVWVVGDATINGSETGTSFKQALYFMSIGFNLSDTMIYDKNNYSPCGSDYCYTQTFEYMFVFSKGYPKTFNIIKVKNIADKGIIKNVQKHRRKQSGDVWETKQITSVVGMKNNNIWNYTNYNETGHPAIFPEQLAQDHIISWSNENDIVYDPFMGSGTTAKMCIKTNRNYIGSEISKEYCELAEKRIKPYKDQLKLAI